MKRALAGAAVAGAGYWLTMSPYSKAFGSFPYRGQGAEKTVALTFDDGPNGPHTARLADILRRRDVRATFFQVGKAVLEYPELTRRLVDEGHVIGNHGFTHLFSNYLSQRTLRADVRQAQDVFAGVGLRPALFRPPWLLRIPATGSVIAKQGMQTVLGEFCHSLEVFQPNPRIIANGAASKVRPGSIIIFHDGFDGHGGNRANTVTAVEMVIDRLRADGYQFATVDELLGIRAYQ